MLLKIFIFCVCAGAFTTSSAMAAEVKLPFYDQVMDILGRVEYSGLPLIIRPQVDLSLDFEKRTWILHNMHVYDDQGVVVLEQGRFGLCAELSAHTYAQIKPLLDDRFYIKFASVTEDGFFPSVQSNHIVLLLFDKEARETYLVDPSYHKYGRMLDFKEYKVYGIEDSLTFMKEQSQDNMFFVDGAMPLFIKDDMLVSFAVTSVDGKFNKDNFLFVVSAHRRHGTSQIDILAVGKRNGLIEGIERKNILQQIISPQEVKILYDQMNHWLKNL